MGNVKIIVALRAILINNFKFEKLRNRKIEEKGNAQKKHYKVAVIYDGVILGVGEGTNKKIAQQEAAGDALTRKVN